MERRRLYVYAAALVALLVLLVVSVAEYLDIASLNQQLGVYQKQQKELSRVLLEEHARDMEAARSAWTEANPQEYVALKNEGITVEADSIMTDAYTVVLDLQDSSGARVDSTAGGTAPGEAVVYLGQYYDDNMTRVPGWEASYTVNTTTHAVTGLTSLLVQNIAYEYYTSRLAPDICLSLGVSNGSVTGSTARSIDCSQLDTGDWMDVTEHKYSLRNVDLREFLLIKTYVNASTQGVTGVDVSKPYYDSVTGSNY
ncbi:MAG TPA: hypothetical protein VMC84_10940 [Methanocella sp.]|uniref:hypothetical protein n=1 Tax=Methanocella sp. TaxID=2052833 RepID=UPI002BBBA0CB|nr:hypothetical protein [Methanocella sp.]HTY91681.1 hypothetical protein [Methanocella sp.]